MTAKTDGVNPSSVTACAVPPSPEGEGSEGAVERKDDPHPALRATFPQGKALEAKEETAEQESYKGFLYTRCGKCGKIKGYCSKSYIKGMRCECGHRTPFRNLRVMTVRCSSCGEVFKYHTNLTEEQFTIECLHCGAPVEMMLHGRTGEYVAY